MLFFFFNDTATTEIYTLSLHDALPISQLIQQYWATNTPSGRVTVLDVDSSGGAYAGIKDAFRAAKDLIALEGILHGARDGGAAAVREIYHATLVPPFCLMAVPSVFRAPLAQSPPRCPPPL